MIKQMLFILLILASCSYSDKKQLNDNRAIKQKQLSKIKNRELYFKFISNLEKTLWSTDLFIKTPHNNGSGWLLIDKNGKYFIEADVNFTEHPDTSIYDYDLTVVTIDNESTNKNGKDKVVNIEYKGADGRTFSIPLEFNYQKTTSMRYVKTIYHFPFTYASIVVNYRDCDNDEYTIDWSQDSIVRYDLDCKEESFFRKETLWKKDIKSSIIKK
jgi:hypothetical protein